MKADQTPAAEKMVAPTPATLADNASVAKGADDSPVVFTITEKQLKDSLLQILVALKRLNDGLEKSNARAQRGVFCWLKPFATAIGKG